MEEIEVRFWDSVISDSVSEFGRREKTEGAGGRSYRINSDGRSDESQMFLGEHN
jgi:hypothetical protein